VVWHHDQQDALQLVGLESCWWWHHRTTCTIQIQCEYPLRFIYWSFDFPLPHRSSSSGIMLMISSSNMHNTMAARLSTLHHLLVIWFSLLPHTSWISSSGIMLIMTSTSNMHNIMATRYPLCIISWIIIIKLIFLQWINKQSLWLWTITRSQ